jgi:hypothetical protein
MREGNLRVPCSCYGHDTESCARVAFAAPDVLEPETGSVTTGDLEHTMGLVVKDHDDPFTLIRDHRSPAYPALMEDLILEDRRPTTGRGCAQTLPPQVDRARAGAPDGAPAPPRRSELSRRAQLRALRLVHSDSDGSRRDTSVRLAGRAEGTVT